MSVVSSSYEVEATYPNGAMRIRETHIVDGAANHVEQYIVDAGTTPAEMADRMAARVAWINAELAQGEFEGLVDG